MPMTTRFDLEAGVRYHTVTGELTIELIQAQLAETYAHPDFRTDQHSVWDIREAEIAVSPEEVHSLAVAVSEAFPGSEQVKAALVVSQDLHYGMSRMYQQVLEGESPHSVGVFREMDEALIWLEI